MCVCVFRVERRNAERKKFEKKGNLRKKEIMEIEKEGRNEEMHP